MPENKMANPVFSIITPTCQRPLLLQRTILSVTQQTFKNYEHIIIDDANDNETVQLVNRLGDKRIILKHHKNPKGANGGYNTGINASRGQFILFLDDDDEYLPTFLEKMFNFFLKSDKKLGFAWTGIARIKDTDIGEKFLLSRIWPSQFSSKEQGLVEATSIGNGFGVCVRKECINTTGLYDESMVAGGDTDFLFRLAINFDFGTIPEVLVKIHQHRDTQLTDDRYYKMRIAAKEKILKRYHDFLSQNPAVYYIHYKTYADLCYKWKLRQKGRKAMFSVIKNTSFRFLNFMDLFFYELSGKDTLTYCSQSKLKNLFDNLKKKKQLATDENNSIF
jgi:glycosyltransferase involved in cell wall biosynthesis